MTLIRDGLMCYHLLMKNAGALRSVGSILSTTEDIQMEEMREKIELLQSYYLVPFRSFDQNPYSPTHLEPFNDHIVVLRGDVVGAYPFSALFIRVWNKC